MLLWIDGFDAYGASGVPAPAGIIARKYPVVQNESSFVIRTGRYGAYALDLPVNSTLYFGKVGLTTVDTVVAGFAVKFSAFDASSRIFFSLYDGATLGVNLHVESTGEISVYRDSTLLSTSIGANLLTNAWNYVELKVKCAGGTSGTYELRVNGATVANSTGANTKAGSNNYHDGFQFCGTTGFYSTIVDDFYFLDSSGSINNGFLSLKKVVTLFPNAVGDVNDWTGSTGPHYTCVNENPTDDDVTYVESSTPTQEELWNYDDLIDSGLVAGIQVNTDCRMTGATGYTLETQVKNGATDSSDAGQAISSSDYATKHRVVELNPRTSGQWTVADLNSTQFGVKVA